MHGETVQSWKERLPEIVRVMIRRIFGIWTKTVYFGEHYPKQDLSRKGRNAGEGRKASREIRFHFLLLLMGLLKSQLLSGIVRILDA